MDRPDRRTVAAAQAAYYIPTAMLPLLSRRRFEAVTGPKLEWWLVVTVAALVGVIGSVLGLASRRNSGASETVILGAGSATALGVIDVVYVARRRISPTYLVDAAIQFALLGGWLIHKRSRA